MDPCCGCAQNMDDQQQSAESPTLHQLIASIVTVHLRYRMAMDFERPMSHLKSIAILYPSTNSSLPLIFPLYSKRRN